MQHQFNKKGELESAEKSTFQIIYDVLAIALPNIVAMISQIMISQLNLSFVGHLSNPAIFSGLGLGNMYLNVFGNAILIGLNSAILTLVSQSYGQNDLKLCGIYLNRGRIVALIACVPISLVMLMAETFFILFNIDAEASSYAQRYITMMIPYICIYVQFDTIKLFLNCFKKSYVAMVLQVITTIIHYFWCYLFVDKLGYEIAGVAIASNITVVTNFIAIILYVTFFEKGLKEAWFLPNRNSFKGLWDYFKIGISSTLMVSLEWWFTELLILMAGWLSLTALGASVIMLNTMYIAYCITLGLNFAASAVVGKSIGAQDIKEARRYQKVITVLGISLALTLLALIYFGRNQITAFYTNSEEIIQVTNQGLKLVAFVEFFDCCQNWQGGVIRGIGMFKHATYGLLFAFYVLALPCCYIFAFLIKLELNGLYLGYMVGVGFLTFFYLYLTVFHYDWQQISYEVYLRRKKENQRQGKPNEEDLFEPLLNNNQD